MLYLIKENYQKQDPKSFRLPNSGSENQELQKYFPTYNYIQQFVFPLSFHCREEKVLGIFICHEIPKVFMEHNSIIIKKRYETKLK